MADVGEEGGRETVAQHRDALLKSLTGGHVIPRLGQPEDVARLVCFLASDEAR